MVNFSKISEFVYTHILVILACFVALMIIVPSVILFATGKAMPRKKMIDVENEFAQLEKEVAPDYSVYNDFGRIRAVTKDGKVLVITPVFSYTKDDSQFFEELSRKSGVLKGIILNYYALLTQKEILKLGETKIKQNLLSQLNSNLSLNKIQNLYFVEYIFLD